MNLRRSDEVIEHPLGRIAVTRLQHADAPDRPWLVFLHEALGSIAMWKDIPEALARATGCHAFSYDRLGHGRSDPLPDELADGTYLARESLEILPFVLKQAQLEDVILVGHSDGGTIALLGATVLGGRARAIVTEAAHVLVEPETLAGIIATTTAADVATLKQKVARYHEQDIEPIFSRWPRVWLSEPFRNWNIEQELATIRCPTLVIQGTGDEFGTARQVDAIAAACSGPVETLLIEDCGHVPHFQARDVWLDKVKDFVNRTL
ncbi:MAG: alpha/beta hydrolase [Geothermobacteraceae bacterium]